MRGCFLGLTSLSSLYIIRYRFINVNQCYTLHAEGSGVKKTAPMVHRVPLTKARINLGQIVRRAHLNNECFILEKDGIPIAGIMDIAEMEDWLELQDPKLHKQIEEGYKEYQQGRARPARDFLAELQPEAGARKKKK